MTSLMRESDDRAYKDVTYILLINTEPFNLNDFCGLEELPSKEWKR